MRGLIQAIRSAPKLLSTALHNFCPGRTRVITTHGSRGYGMALAFGDGSESCPRRFDCLLHVLDGVCGAEESSFVLRAGEPDSLLQHRPVKAREGCGV
jgi:hypothetical protein